MLDTLGSVHNRKHGFASNYLPGVCCDKVKYVEGGLYFKASTRACQGQTGSRVARHSSRHWLTPSQYCFEIVMHNHDACAVHLSYLNTSGRGLSKGKADEQRHIYIDQDS